MFVVEGSNILDVESGVIVHQVNCMGAMGAGVALAIRKKWPVVYTSYKVAAERNLWSLGKIQVVPVGEGLYVCNLAGQYRYGREKRHTDYLAVTTGFLKLRDWCQGKGITEVHIPYKMGCVLGGGDWEEYQKAILESGIESDKLEHKITVYIHKKI